MSEFIVFRHHPEIPELARDPNLEGKWIDKPAGNSLLLPDDPGDELFAYAEPNGMTESREDGATAEVWVIHLPRGLPEGETQ